MTFNNVLHVIMLRPAWTNMISDVWI